MSDAVEERTAVEAGRARRRVLSEVAEATAGWIFHVPMPAFQGVFDIERSERAIKEAGPEGRTNRLKTGVWTQGHPPAYRFGIGDIFYAPGLSPAMPWAEQKANLQWHLQVVELDQVAPTVEVRCYASGRKLRLTLEHRQIAEILKTGAGHLF